MCPETVDLDQSQNAQVAQNRLQFAVQLAEAGLGLHQVRREGDRASPGALGLQQSGHQGLHHRELRPARGPSPGAAPDGSAHRSGLRTHRGRPAWTLQAGQRLRGVRETREKAQERLQEAEGRQAEAPKNDPGGEFVICY